MEKVQFEEEEIKRWNKRHFVQNKTDMHLVLLPRYTKLISKGVFLRAFAFDTLAFKKLCIIPYRGTWE